MLEAEHEQIKLEYKCSNREINLIYGQIGCTNFFFPFP